MKNRETMRPLEVAWRMLVPVCVVALVAATGASAKKDDSKREDANPLAGKFAGTNQEGHPVSFRITNGGKVVDYSTVMTLICYPPTPTPPPGEPPTFPTGTLVPVTVTFPPHKLEQPKGNFPKGKRFTYEGPDPQFGGELFVTGKPTGSPTKMAGFISLKRVDGASVGLPGQTCRNRQNGEQGGFGLVNYDVKKGKG